MKKFLLGYRALGRVASTYANPAKISGNCSNPNTKAKIPHSRVDQIFYHNQNIGENLYHVLSIHERPFVHQENALIAKTLYSEALSEERKAIFRH